MALAPGSYAAISLNANAVLTLSAGTYSTESLDLEPDSEVRIPQTGVVQLNVRSSLIYRGQIVAVGNADPNLLLLYLGTGAVTLERRFNGFYVGVGAALTLTGNQGLVHRGAFFARDISVTPDVHVEHRSFDPLLFP